MHIVEKHIPPASCDSYEVLQKTGLVAVAAVDCLSISRVHRLHIVSFVCWICGSSVGRILTINIAKGLAMARSSKLITLCVALVAFVAVRSVAFLGAPGPQAQLRGTPLEIAAGAAVPAVLMTPTAAMAADGAPSVVLGVGILCMLAAFSAVSSVISATVTSELD